MFRFLLSCEKLVPRFLTPAKHNYGTGIASESSVKLQELNKDKEININPLPEEDPLQHDDYFGVKQLVTLKDLFDARVHLGHKSGVRNIHMRPYIFGTRLNVDIIDLDQTLSHLRDALNFTAHVAYRQGIILFLSRNKETIPIVERTALECKEYSHCRAWKLGTFTNATVEFGSITRLPDLCIFMSTHDTVFNQHLGITEVAKCNIPSIGILDTSCDPRLITYPVPGNDDTPCAVQLYCHLFKQAILKGKEKRKLVDEKKSQNSESD